MMRVLKFLLRGSLALIALLIVAILTRGYWLPQRFAVNIPLQALIGKAAGAVPDGSVDRLQLPPGFTISRFATGLNNARFMRVTSAGDVIVSQPREGKVTLLFNDANHDGASDGSLSLLTDLDRPHGLALHDGYLYVAEMTAVGRVRFDGATRKITGIFERVITGLPSGGNHWTRTIGFGPDGFLYVSVGSSCNVCVESDHRRAAILRYDPATWQGRIFAGGLRNSVGFAWRQPNAMSGEDPELIATDNGRDLLGDDFPPCELNRVVDGGFYGWPYANGHQVKDPDFGAGHEAEIAASLSPIHDFSAHNAPLGITFLDADSTPPEYRGAALVALHGSWNRSKKDGYKVVSLHWGADGRITQKDFLTGFLNDDDVTGRPVDIAQGTDGAIFVSDDFSGSVFRVAVGTRTISEPATKVAAEVAPTPATATAEVAPKILARGQKVWNDNLCDTCHNPATMAQAAPKTTKVLEKLPTKYDVAKLVVYLKAPQPPMPLFELSDQERLDLAAYVLNRFR
ncbi:MAG: PQQ-dependent sugar dehydrogenase [Vicinamibacteria bacterium]